MLLVTHSTGSQEQSVSNCIPSAHSWFVPSETTGERRQIQRKDVGSRWYRNSPPVFAGRATRNPDQTAQQPSCAFHTESDGKHRPRTLRPLKLLLRKVGRKGNISLA